VVISGKIEDHITLSMDNDVTLFTDSIRKMSTSVKFDPHMIVIEPNQEVPEDTTVKLKFDNNRKITDRFGNSLLTTELEIELQDSYIYATDTVLARSV
jgi:hypothetical protein